MRCKRADRVGGHCARFLHGDFRRRIATVDREPEGDDPLWVVLVNSDDWSKGHDAILLIRWNTVQVDRDIFIAAYQWMNRFKLFCEMRSWIEDKSLGWWESAAASSMRRAFRAWKRSGISPRSQ